MYHLHTEKQRKCFAEAIRLHYEEGYGEDYYKFAMERVEKQLPIAAVHSVESQDESIAIYNAAPYRLDKKNARKGALNE